MSSLECRGTEFSCIPLHGEEELCFPGRYQCDGVPECKDNLDETNCGNYKLDLIRPTSLLYIIDQLIMYTLFNNEIIKYRSLNNYNYYIILYYIIITTV